MATAAADSETARGDTSDARRTGAPQYGGAMGALGGGLEFAKPSAAPAAEHCSTEVMGVVHAPTVVV